MLWTWHVALASAIKLHYDPSQAILLCYPVYKQERYHLLPSKKGEEKVNQDLLFTLGHIPSKGSQSE